MVHNELRHEARSPATHQELAALFRRSFQGERKDTKKERKRRQRQRRAKEEAAERQRQRQRRSGRVTSDNDSDASASSVGSVGAVRLARSVRFHA